MLSSVKDQSRLEQTGGTSVVPVWATSDNVVAVADVVVVLGCSCCCSCCFWCCCKFHFGCFIVVAGIILRHLSQSWHDWLEQSRKQTTQLESWTRGRLGILGRLDRVDSLGKWTENWTCSPHNWLNEQAVQLEEWLKIIWPTLRILHMLMSSLAAIRDVNNVVWPDLASKRNYCTLSTVGAR